jgi:hypothetical protein
MPELKERFLLTDEVGTPDLWAEARRRASTVERPLPVAVSGERPDGWRRLVTAAVAFAVFTAAVLFAWEAFHPDGALPGPGPSLDRFDLSVYTEGWTRLPDPPEVRSDAATAWTEGQLLIWGGVDTAVGDILATGLSFDPATGSWHDLPAAPLEARSLAAFAWTGEEFLIWGGRHEPAFPNADTYFDDGAAFDPATRTWRMLPAAPIEARAPFSVWTGQELIVWGNRTRDLRYVDGAAYEPATDSWRPIADAPIELTDATAVWTGKVMIVFGAALHGGNSPESETAIGAAYDPETDAWKRIADSDLSPQASTAAWDGKHLIAWDYENHTASYDQSADSWRRLPDVDIWMGECPPESIALHRLVLGNYCGILVSHDEGAREWRTVRGSRRVTADLVTPIAAGSVAFVLEYDREATNGQRMFVYKPPATAGTDATSGVLEPEPFVPEVERDGDLVRMPITFPDGSSATVVYPTSLHLASLGVQPDVSYLWRDDPPPRFPIIFLHGRKASVEEYVDGTGPVGFVNSYRSIEIWKMSDAWSGRRVLVSGHWLTYELPSWTVLVALDRPEYADDVAAGLDLRQTAAGFPVANTSGPIALSEESGEGEGSVLTIGSSLDPSVVLWLERCEGGDHGIEGSGEYASKCVGDGRISAGIYGDPITVAAIFEGLRVEDFRRA